MSSSINVKYPSYIPTKDGSQTKRKSSLVNLVLYVLFGCSSSWSLINTFYCELAWIETTQPEGVDFAAWIGLMQAVGSVIVLFIFYIDTLLLCRRKVFVYAISALSVLTCLVLSFSWDFTVNGVSLFLQSGVVMASIIGWVQFVTIIPWLVRNFNPRMLSAFLAGDGLMTLNLVILEIIQEPGGARTFSPNVFYLLAAMIYSASFVVAVYILQNDIEREVPEDVEKVTDWQTSLWLQFFPTGWRKVIRYFFIQLWLVTWVWWVIPTALPFAAANTTDSSTNSGTDYLQWILALGFLGMLCGYLCSYLVTEKFWINEAIILFSLMGPIIILAAAGIGDWTSWTMRTILMIVAISARVLFGWIIVLIFREIMLKYPENGEALCRYCSLWTLVSGVFILTLQWWLIISGVV